MANLLWGKVFFKDHYAGIVSELPGDRTSFQYDDSYLNSVMPPIAHTLPKQEEAFISNAGLLPFFDNLVAEGWLEQAQTRALEKRQASRFELLLAFGFDCIGAVSIIDPEPSKTSRALIDVDDPREIAILTSRASLSGVQPKVALVLDNGKLRASKIGETSTHIAKFPSAGHDDILFNEYLTTIAFQALLPNDQCVDLSIQSIAQQNQPALVIKRFDRSNGEKLHFEEFNQLLGQSSMDKYTGAYKDMSDFIANAPGCLPIESYKLFNRIIAGILLGNTDMHLKNFAMFHTSAGLRLTPSYDQVAAMLYQYKTMALSIAGTNNLKIGDIKPRHVIFLMEEFNLSADALMMSLAKLDKYRQAAQEAIFESEVGESAFKDQLIKLMDKRWNGTFSLVGEKLSQKQKNDGNTKA